MKVRVPIANTPGKTAQIETDATVGATLGVNLYWPDGALVSPDDFAALASTDPVQQPDEDRMTLWRLLLEVPANVEAIASLAAAGIVRRAGDGTWTAAPLSSDDLPDIPDTGGGTLQRFERDAKGRVSGTSEATTDDLPEGSRLYYTDERAAAAAPVQSVNGMTGDVVVPAGGDVAGPASATDDELALFDGTTGKLIKASGETIASMRRVPQNSKSAAYTLVLSDAGKHILHPSADATARTFTIPANASVAFPVGTVVTFVNQNGAGAVTIAITSDTLRLAGAGTTGSRTLAANGIATAIKVTATEWLINGTGLT